MRGSPSCVIAVRRFALWRLAVALVGAAALASLVAWVCLAPLGQSALARLSIGLASACALALAVSLGRLRAGTLRWDGSSWAFAELAMPQAMPMAGELDVALDLGAFLLLRFTSGDAPGRRRVHWIPVERRGLEREWHSFRCAVYSPRPAPGTAPAADPQPD
jgi:hypothetical protein